MSRSFTARLLAFLVLLLHGGAFAAASVLDGSVAARANATGAHVETASGDDCAAHDEATCLLCRAGTTGVWLPQRAMGGLTAAHTVPPTPADASARTATLAGAPLSRAPPVA
ncbi:MAG: hypothetical protein AB1762_03685 [Gemmatimonadota bacterium]